MQASQRPGPPRVLLGNLEPLVRLGMATVLEEEGVEVLESEERAQSLPLAAQRLRPDAVVLDRDEHTSRELADRVRRASPLTRVILWARDEDAMDVFDPGETAPRHFLFVGPEELRSALRGSQMNRVEE